MKRALLSLLLLAACSTDKPVSSQEAPAAEESTQQVKMGQEAQQHAGIKVTSVTTQRLTEYLHVTGTVQPMDSRVAEVHPLARGRIETVLVQVGDRVQQGQPLARFESFEGAELRSDYESERAELERLKVQLATAASQMERNRSLVEIGAIPKKEFEASQGEHNAIVQSVKAQEHRLAGLTVRLNRLGVTTDGGPTWTAMTSPFGGVVLSVSVSPGELIDAEHSLFSVADLSRVWVQAEVYEKDLGRIRTGQNAFVTVDTYPGERFPARVTHISDVLDPETRTVRVRCEVDNSGLRLKLGMFANVALPTTFQRQALAVPTGAIQQINGRPVVFIRVGESDFKQQQVVVGKAVEGLTEISGGLTEGSAVVVEGAFHLKSIVLGSELGEEEEEEKER